MLPTTIIKKSSVCITGSLLGLLILLLISCSGNPELQWVEEDGYRWAEVKTGFLDREGFERLSASKTNIHFVNGVSEEKILENRHYLNGAGVAVADVTGNGLPDIYFAGLEEPNRLYENLGNYRFRDITEKAGLAHEGTNSTGVVFADVNGNGYPDLLITSLTGQNSLYINDGNGQFTLKEDSGLGKSMGAKTMTLADINANGKLDLYITNYNRRTVRDLYDSSELLLEKTVKFVEGRMKVLPEFEEYYTIFDTVNESYRGEKGVPDELWLNVGEGRFEKADPLKHFFDEFGNPMGLPADWGLTAAFRDITGNGFPDLYVANDFWTPDRVWINQGDGTFRAIKKEAIRSFSHSAMGVAFSDINRNNLLDIVTVEMLSSDHQLRMRQLSDHIEEFDGRTLHNRNSVYLNRGDNTFAQIAYYSGLEASEWSWAATFLDVNLNGYEDLIITTGYAKDYQDMDVQVAAFDNQSVGTEGSDNVLEYPPLALQNKLFRNNGDLTFTDVSTQWGFETEDFSMGLALADLNNNGTPDVIINRFNAEAAIYKNRTNAPRIAVRLRGKAPNTRGIGAEIIIEGAGVNQSKQVAAGGDYLSGSQPQVVFAADNANHNHTITVNWPGGRQSVVEHVQANRIYEIDESQAVDFQPENLAQNEDNPPLFIDESHLLNHTHHENIYDDFRFGPLLPAKLSRTGPGVAWFDINQNGYDDLLITSGRGGEPGWFNNTDGHQFTKSYLSPLTDTVPGDQPSVIGWAEHGNTRIAIGSANYEQGNPSVPSAYIYSFETNGQDRSLREIDQIPGILSTTGPVAAADYTGNGYADLFIGGRHKPGQYPKSANSRLFRNSNGSFELDEENSALLEGAGLVTDALFADITGNGMQDLLISTEWGTLRLFENRAGRFREVTEEVGLATYKGWWNGIAIGDFTNNGLPDIVALNMGLNSPYQAREGRPLRLYYDDFNWDGRLNIADAYYDEATGGYVPRRRLHDFESVPTILQQVQTHSEFATSTVDQIFDLSFDEVPFKEINTLEHMLFINTCVGFEASPLPVKAQFSSGFYAGVADFDNDGNEDLFISQNFFGFPKHVSRLDAGRGLLLKGDGQGNLRPVAGHESGIRVYGDQRGAALADFNRNGKTDLVVTQNNGPVRLFRNNTETRGLRVKLVGPASNQNAIGASIRLVYEDGTKGPRRFLQAGGGYGSQNSYVQVLGINKNKTPSGIEVTWPDGTTEVEKVSLRQKDHTITYSNGH